MPPRTCCTVALLWLSVSALEHVPFYIEDALSQLLEHKEEYTQFGIVRFFADYFNSVRNGNHILFREFSFVKATPHNRSSFLRAFWRSFRQIGKNGGKGVIAAGHHVGAAYNACGVD
ncbi:UPF0705 protein C11orf49-like [Acipenser ruthenus]|uniref:Centriolar satellite-associated tubulin polyglutamylase complex regulator 1 n=1 Tax=Acipenser ruthenus TaxID=7906 RepID=A0A444U106_ACIRT|nr:UPF0705 protein C11orf49-like [Acipenser ruthenus]